MPTSTSASGPNACPNKCNGLSTTVGRAIPVCPHSSPQAMGSGMGWMTEPRTADRAARYKRTPGSPPGLVRPSASSNATDATVSRISACTAMSVNSVTTLGCP